MTELKYQQFLLVKLKNNCLYQLTHFTQTSQTHKISQILPHAVKIQYFSLHSTYKLWFCNSRLPLARKWKMHFYEAIKKHNQSSRKCLKSWVGGFINHTTHTQWLNWSKLKLQLHDVSCRRWTNLRWWIYKLSTVRIPLWLAALHVQHYN